MVKDKKQYIQFDPTQVSKYGSGENSAQTISRKVKGVIDNPLDTVVKWFVLIIVFVFVIEKFYLLSQGL